MSKSVSYSVVPRKNPMEPNADPRFYAQAQANGDVTTREMAERIQKTCTVTRADVVAVLTALEDVIVEALSAGEIVRLGDLGAFQIGLSGKGANTEDRYEISLIKKAKINFRPGSALSGMLTALTFNKVGKLSKKTASEPEEGDDNPIE
ncbi:HU family DNA-binding protein [Phocaeicola sp.]